MLRQIAADGLFPVEKEPFRIDGDAVPLAEHVEGRSQAEPFVRSSDLRFTAGKFGQEGGAAAPGANAKTDSPIEFAVRFSNHRFTLYRAHPEQPAACPGENRPAP